MSSISNNFSKIGLSFVGNTVNLVKKVTLATNSLAIIALSLDTFSKMSNVGSPFQNLVNCEKPLPVILNLVGSVGGSDPCSDRYNHSPILHREFTAREISNAYFVQMLAIPVIIVGSIAVIDACNKIERGINTLAQKIS